MVELSSSLQAMSDTMENANNRLGDLDIRKRLFGWQRIDNFQPQD